MQEKYRNFIIKNVLTLMIAGGMFFGIMIYLSADESGKNALLNSSDPESALENFHNSAEFAHTVGTIFICISLIGIIILIFMVVTRRAENGIKCPACMSRIHPQAKVCKYCRTNILTTELSQNGNT